MVVPATRAPGTDLVPLPTVVYDIPTSTVLLNWVLTAPDEIKSLWT